MEDLPSASYTIHKREVKNCEMHYRKMKSKLEVLVFGLIIKNGEYRGERRKTIPISS